MAPTTSSDHPAAVPPHDPAAEAAILGAILRTAQDDNTHAAQLLEHTPTPGDYYRPAHETLANHLAKAAADNDPLDPAAILARLHDAGDLKSGYLDGPYLHHLIEQAPPAGSTDWHTRRVQRYARIRRAHTAATQVTHRLANADVDDVLDALVQAMDDIETALQEEINGHPAHHRITVETIDEILAGDDDTDTYDWIVPGLLERGDRLIITGPEGGGKSTLLRQLAIQLAAGIHPFTGELITPLRILYVDLENSRNQFRRKARPLRIKAGDLLDPDRLHMSFRGDGLDLTQPEDVSWLDRHVAATRPDLLITGPIYKLANGDPTEEKSAKPVAMALDRIRIHHGCAVVLEAHSSKAFGGTKKRAHEPYGWSGWLRWPEFGIWLDKEGEIEHWRGMRDERAWPELLMRGGEWPWTIAQSENGARWTRIRACVMEAGERLSNREIARRTGISEPTVRRVLGEFGMQYAGLLAQIERDVDDA